MNQHLRSGLVSASGWADLLVYSDLVQPNLHHLLTTLSTPGPALPSLSYIAQIEHCSVDSLLSRLVSTPLVVTTCNILHRPVLPHISLGVQPSIVLTKLCIEFAISTQDQVSTVLRNIASMLRSGGVLVIMGALGESFYMVGNKEFPAVALSREVMETALVKADMEMMTWEERKRSSDKRKHTGHTGVFFMVAKRKN